MTENASPSTPTLTDAQRTVWDVNRLVTMDRHDLATELAGADRGADAAPAVPAPVRRGVRAAHRVVLRSAGRR